MKITKFLFNFFILSLLLTGQSYALDCFFGCRTEIQAEKFHDNHDDCKKERNTSKDKKHHNCNIGFCLLPFNDAKLTSVEHISYEEKINKIPPLNICHDVIQLPLKHIVFSSSLFLDDKIQITSSTPLFIRIKHLLV